MESRLAGHAWNMSRFFIAYIIDSLLFEAGNSQGVVWMSPRSTEIPKKVKETHVCCNVVF